MLPGWLRLPRDPSAGFYRNGAISLKGDTATMQIGQRLFATALCGLGLLTLGIKEASASPLIVRFLGTTAEGANTRFNYRLEFTQGEFFRTNDYFTIYDFDGFVSASAGTLAANFNVTTQNLGVTPPDVLTNDNAGITNVTFRYTGAAILGNMDAANRFDEFSIVSRYNAFAIDDYTGFSTQVNNVPLGETKVETVGRNAIVVAAIPEPGTMALLAPALLGGLAVIRRRKA